MNDFAYVGSELDLFAAVHNWKSYWAEQLRPYITGDVLEVGAGIGSNTPHVNKGGHRRWVCLEPDPKLVNQLRSNLEQSEIGRACQVICGITQDLEGSQFDTIVYIDVLEHIENDRQELQLAARLLRPGGLIVMLSPAHQWLFTPFDAGIGHFRRYNKRMLREVTPNTLRLESVWYLDSVGLLLSTGNRFLLRQSMPAKEQLRFWDRYVIPTSKVMDRGFRHCVGKSIVGVWTTP